MSVKLENLIKNYKLNYTNSKKLVSSFRCIKCEKKLQPDKIIYFHHEENKKYTTYSLGYYVMSLIACRCGTKLLLKIGFDDEYMAEMANRSRMYSYTISSLESLKEYKRLQKIFNLDKYNVRFIKVYNGCYNAIETEITNGIL